MAKKVEKFVDKVEKIEPIIAPKIEEIIPEPTEQELLNTEINNFIFTYMQGRSNFVSTDSKNQFKKYVKTLLKIEPAECGSCFAAYFAEMKKITSYDNFYKNKMKK